MNKAYRKTIWLLTWTNFLTVEIQSFLHCSMIFDIHIYHNTGQSCSSCPKLVLLGKVWQMYKMDRLKTISSTVTRHDVFPVSFFVWIIITTNKCLCLYRVACIFVCCKLNCTLFGKQI